MGNDSHNRTDIRGVTATSTLGVVRVNRAAFERRDSVLYVRGLVQRVRVDGHLNVVFIGHGHAK